MAGELSGSSFEVPKKIENQEGSSLERLDLGLEKSEPSAEKQNEVVTERPVVNIPTPTVQPPVTPLEKRRKEVESLMAKGLDEIYLSLPVEKRREFKEAGEETAMKINDLLEKTKVNIGKIVNLIKKWLSLLPGVNKMFLEQEAKIRTDEIMKLKKKD